MSNLTVWMDVNSSTRSPWESFCRLHFLSELVVACRSSLDSALKARGLTSSTTKRTRHWQSEYDGYKTWVGDPDAHFASMVAGGLRTGALSSLPRTPADFEKKSKWVLPEESFDRWDGERWRDNRVSAAERPDVIRKQFEEEVEECHMTKVTVKKAREERREHLVVASLGAVEKNIEADEWRVVCDVTHGVRVSNQIQVLDQVRFPGWPDLVAYLDEMAAFDVRRRIPIVRTEWGLLALGGQLSYHPTTTCCT